MSERALTPIALKERIEILDVLRGMAVCGILIGNMQWFSGYGMMPPLLQEASSIHDKITTFLVHFFIEGKFYSIFSFLFGVGFAIQIARADERGDSGASLFKRRLFWLLVIGLLHAYLLWAGDIVSIYAFMGFLLLLFRKKLNESLLKWAGVLIGIPIVTYVVFYILFVLFVSADSIEQFRAGQIEGWHSQVTMVQQSSYWEVISGYNLRYVIGRYAGLIIQMRLPKILAMFLLGLYAYRIGVFQNLSQHQTFIRRVMICGLALGVVGNLAMAALAGNEAPFPPSLSAAVGVLGYAIGVPALALGIVALVAMLWEKRAWYRLLRIVAPVGQMALTNYLAQTIICVTIFYGFGFGLFGTVGATKATLMALSIFLFQVVFSTVWLRFFTYGPVEWLWRQLTYGRRFGLRRGAVA